METILPVPARHRAEENTVREVQARDHSTVHIGSDERITYNVNLIFVLPDQNHILPRQALGENGLAGWYGSRQGGQDDDQGLIAEERSARRLARLVSPLCHAFTVLTYPPREPPPSRQPLISASVVARSRSRMPRRTQELDVARHLQADALASLDQAIIGGPLDLLREVLNQSTENLASNYSTARSRPADVLGETDNVLTRSAEAARATAAVWKIRVFILPASLTLELAIAPPLTVDLIKEEIRQRLENPDDDIYIIWAYYFLTNQHLRDIERNPRNRKIIFLVCCTAVRQTGLMMQTCVSATHPALSSVCPFSASVATLTSRRPTYARTIGRGCGQYVTRFSTNYTRRPSRSTSLVATS
ncbi:hypothetical protein AAFC00_002703 [Neodothiora populina]|uniref:Uncharacterized protein n=1 Tax=Neodothiora populina TaxID=2781224 RepID=A0ABR3P894_9PEZI